MQDLGKAARAREQDAETDEDLRPAGKLTQAAASARL